MIYSKYLISRSDSFNPDNFPKVVAELDSIRTLIDSRVVGFDTEMLVTFLRDNGVENKINPNNVELPEIISSHKLPVDHLEGLYLSCNNNKAFREELEGYIRTRCRKVV